MRTVKLLVLTQLGFVVKRLSTDTVRSTYNSPGKKATATLYVAEFAVVAPTVTPTSPLNTYCVAPPKVSVAGLGNTILKELLLHISVGGDVVGAATAILFLIVLRI